jgi:hypothetical protein
MKIIQNETKQLYQDVLGPLKTQRSVFLIKVAWVGLASKPGFFTISIPLLTILRSFVWITLGVEASSFPLGVYMYRGRTIAPKA